MPFGGRLAYFAWPLGLLCLHLARLLPVFSHRVRPSARAPWTIAPGGHRACSSLVARGRSGLPRSLATPLLVAAVDAATHRPCLLRLAAAANPHHTPPAISPRRGPKPKMRHLCKNVQIRARLVEDSGDLDTIEGVSFSFQLPPSPAWAEAQDASSLQERADSRRLPPSSLVRLVEDSGDLDTIEGAYESLLKMYPNDIDSGMSANVAMEGAVCVR
ncbi:hypothetical protein EDB89DRAFT_2198675 [Lactarius sanguifluus]|nr:hypothetical protein EDB89DRAFT_2198675 [Lactarius sanguifluus]